MIQLTVALDINTTYFNGLTLKMTNLRPHQEAKPCAGDLGVFNRESDIDNLLKALIN
jgi:hypothetical protein